MLKEDEEETEVPSDFDIKSLIPDTKDCSEEHHQRIVAYA